MSDARDLLQDPNFIQDLYDTELSAGQIVTKYGCGPTFVKKHRKNRGIKRGSTPARPATAFAAVPEQETTEESSTGAKSYTFLRERPVTLEDAREWIRESGDDPDDYNVSARSVAYGTGQWSNKMSAWPKVARTAEKDGPAWPVIQQALPVVVHAESARERVVRANGFKLAMKCADHQIGFRALPDGTFDPFHDDKAMDLFIEVVRQNQPDTVQVLGDFLDLTSQGKYVQEAGFARTTQMAIDTGHAWLAKLRHAAPNAEIIIIEGNHDVRMQRFVEANALAAFGLTQANKPDSWPVMSLPFLLRLEELGIEYVDAYPAATYWDKPDTRNIHGTRANSKGSTMGQYLHELSHINTWAGHTHRAEIIYRTVIGHSGAPIESYAANPGCLCRTDGSVPSVHGATGAKGIPATVVEDWQQGFGMLYYTETESWPYVYRIKNGKTVIGDKIISV